MHALSINAHLTNKYDIHFNFFLTKPITEMVYNHTAATTTISFKDTVILADNNQYLKRYYFLKNALDKDEIVDRIRLLAEFYGNAVILRHEYPLMVLTRTKSIFLKRLKRMKKMLVEEGSSDQSKSNREQKAVSVNSSQFLKSVSSSQLQRKSFDEGNQLHLDFSLFRQTEYQVFDIFQDEPSREQSRRNSNSAMRIIGLAQTLTQELVLQRQQKQEELKHLMIDFQLPPAPKIRQIVQTHTSSDHQRDRTERGNVYGRPFLKLSQMGETHISPPLKYSQMGMADQNGVPLKYSQMPQPQTTRDHLRDRAERGRDYGSPLLKYSSIINDKGKARERAPLGQHQHRYSNLLGEFKTQKYYEGGGSPRFSSAMQQQQSNRMTSINININNLEEKKEPRVNVKLNSKGKYHLGEDFDEDQRNYRAEKKRKIREKAAALLNRVKSQEYMRTNQGMDREYPPRIDHYLERYY